MTTSTKLVEEPPGAVADAGGRMQGAPTAAPGARCSYTSLVGHSRSSGVELERFACQAQALADGRCPAHRLCATEACGGTVELHHEYGSDLCGACHDRLDEERYPPPPFHEPRRPVPVLCPHGFSDRICYDCRSDEYERRQVHINRNERI